MDRDNRWNRVEKAYDLYTKGIGIKEQNPVDAIQNSYSRKETDEFISPIIITDNNASPVATINNDDGIIFFNFRADRAREIASAFTEPSFDAFSREYFYKLCDFVCMTRYDENFTDLPVAFPPIHYKNILGEIISKYGLNQLRIAETEKYAHVTYFFNGGEEKPFPLEDRLLVQSPRDVSYYDEKPEMSALKVTEEVIKKINLYKYDLIVLNFANMDMVGHTGNLDAAIKACETVDKCVKKILHEIRKKNGVAIITADHGNAEEMKSKDGGRHTAHTTNPVYFILVDETRKKAVLNTGKLGDIAPTILDIMGIEKPEEMTGTSLL